VSGGGLLAVMTLGYLEREHSWLFYLHVITMEIGTLILFPHVLYSIVRHYQNHGEIKKTVTDKENQDSGRRDFLRYVAGGILFAGIGVVWKWLNQQAATVKSETIAFFAQCNKMMPAPIPLPESLPPKGGGYTGRFKVYKIGSEIPCSTSADWTFTVSGLVDEPLSFAWVDFLKLPRVVQVSDFHCVEGWSVYTITYEGIRLSEILEKVGVKPQAKFVKFYSAEKIYTDSLSLEQARLPDVMVAILLDGQEIPSDLGGPARLVIPRMYAYKAVKWLVGMELIDKPYKGYWEERGYPSDAWIKPGNV
jgi:DMSO/TMAO reductase YedYZ molybdopterin-dependent catalytic subunit